MDAYLQINSKAGFHVSVHFLHACSLALLYRRRGLSHTLSHSVSHSVSHMTYGGAEPIVPPAHEGHRRKFSEADKRRIVEEAVQSSASVSEVARPYGIAARVLFRWKQDLTQVAPLFVTVEIIDAIPPVNRHGVPTPIGKPSHSSSKRWRGQS